MGGACTDVSAKADYGGAKLTLKRGPTCFILMLILIFMRVLPGAAKGDFRRPSGGACRGGAQHLRRQPKTRDVDLAQQVVGRDAPEGGVARGPEAQRRAVCRSKRFCLPFPKRKVGRRKGGRGQQPHTEWINSRPPTQDSVKNLFFACDFSAASSRVKPAPTGVGAGLTRDRSLANNKKPHPKVRPLSRNRLVYRNTNLAMKIAVNTHRLAEISL
ncbi:hypothetical protein PS652_03285 [Pseudomonas fluorescens]|uniref:Uncharacterized protein n=1 Tax=Pseudomonas fluorescens TaxID=294 RepID=A0A5E6R9C6_PSEFL|nr:hypothetical protein PS652_01329 [Pseudomonas fluorescens]